MKDKKSGHYLNIVIETPKGSTEKYAYDEATGFFKLKKILASGMVFPFDFGFITGTRGEDGDPLDIMILSEFRSFPGCMMECRLLGAIKASQTEKKGKKVRNDRYLAIPALSALYRDIAAPGSLPKKMITELEDFFINYNKEDGKVFRPLGFVNAEHAWKAIRSTMDAPLL